MLLFLLRHGDAIEIGYDDAERPLSPAGERQAAIVGKFLKSAFTSAGTIMSSPLVRACRTAEIVRAELGIHATILTENLLPGTDESFLIDEINAYSSTAKLLVGHEPQLRSLFLKLTGDRMARVEFRKGALACLESSSILAPGSAALKWVLSNEEMEKRLQAR